MRTTIFPVYHFLYFSPIFAGKFPIVCFEVGVKKMGLIPQDFYLWGLYWLSLQHLWRSRPLLRCVAYLFSPLYFFFGLGNYLLVAEIVQNARAGARWY